MKILLVFGTRPEAIKMAPLVKEFQKDPEKFDVKICVTAQHRQMLDQVLDIFDIQPDYDLNIMAPNQDLYDITTKVLLEMREILKDCKPDVIFVHGDTTTSMATALAAFYQQIKVGHVEAGLRTCNLLSPWPEEMNRQVTDRICDYYFAPTEQSRQNLLNEGIADDKIVVTGNTVIDALFHVVSKINSDSSLQQRLQQHIRDIGYPNFNYFPSDTFFFNIKPCDTPHSAIPYILVTGHRRENFGKGTTTNQGYPCQST
jgi:UDP-N-acetylglucosamine 2-epimerase (non-hydrolysing)